MENFDYNYHVIADALYREKHLNLNPSNLYPEGWVENTDWKTKTEIIQSAVTEGKLIGDSKAYKKYVLSKNHNR